MLKKSKITIAGKSKKIGIVVIEISFGKLKITSCLKSNLNKIFS